LILKPQPRPRPRTLSVFAPERFPNVISGDNIAELIISNLAENELTLAQGDVLVIAQKVVSKAEGRFVDLSTVQPSDDAKRLGAETQKDARIVDVVLSESKSVVRVGRNLIITEHSRGFIMANAGVDQSNVAPQDGSEKVLLLPEDPDQSAERLRERLERQYGCKVAVVINDSFGRPWRRGTVGTAIGSAGLPCVVDMRGAADLFGRVLQVTEIGFADEIASTASLLMGQASEGRPIVVLRGLSWTAPASPATSMCRPPEEDLFR
jgi:coenzyme F420-0:L-glutamate ligase/coenzyme F420-1:gamma-L-glutamate ligase